MKFVPQVSQVVDCSAPVSEVAGGSFSFNGHVCLPTARPFVKVKPFYSGRIVRSDLAILDILGHRHVSQIDYAVVSFNTVNVIEVMPGVPPVEVKPRETMSEKRLLFCDVDAVVAGVHFHFSAGSDMLLTPGLESCDEPCFRVIFESLSNLFCGYVFLDFHIPKEKGQQREVRNRYWPTRDCSRILWHESHFAPERTLAA